METGERILEPEMVLQRIGGDRERLHELYEIALEEIPRWKKDMRTVLATGDQEKIRKMAHSCKGASATLGAEKIRSLFYDIEKSATDGDLLSAGDLFENMIEKLDQLENEIRSVLED